MIGNKPGWGLKVRVWVERNHRKVLGHGRVELLEQIDRYRSITAAARRMKMSYRRAWTLVRDMNEAAGELLVEVAVGGSGGGGATLTPRGKEAIILYQSIVARVASAATEFSGSSSRK